MSEIDFAFVEKQFLEMQRECFSCFFLSKSPSMDTINKIKFVEQLLQQTIRELPDVPEKDDAVIKGIELIEDLKELEFAIQDLLKKRNAILNTVEKQSKQ